MKKLTFSLLVALSFAFPVFAQTDVDSIVRKAKTMFLSKQRAEAVEEINKAIALEPGNPDLYLTRAEFYLFLQNKSEVLNDAQKAAALAPTDKKILYRAGLVLLRGLQFKEALKISEELTALGDLDRQGWGLRIQIKRSLKDFIGAFEDASRAIELFPEDDYLKQAQADLIRLLGDSEKALEIYDSIIAANEKKLSLANAQSDKTSIKRALSLFLFNRARINLAKSLMEPALADLAKAIEYLPDGNNYFRRAGIYVEHKMYAEALADFSKIIDEKLIFDRSFVYLQRGNVYFMTQKYAEALADYEEAVKLNESMRQYAQKRIALIKQKTTEISQPK